MLKFAVCDDNIIILNRLTKMLESIFLKNNLCAEVVLSSNSSKELIEYTNSNNLDVLILDIDFKSECSGLELAKKIRAKNKDMYLIFSTGHLEYALIAYKLKTFDYLPKPVTPERLEETVNRIFDDIKLEKESNFINIGNSKILVKQSEIDYIKKDGMKIIYHTPCRTYEAYSSFSKIEESLPENFVRCHKSYIVNTQNIVNIESSNNTILFASNNSCYIGPKYKNNLMKVFTHANFTKCLDSINN